MLVVHILPFVWFSGGEEDVVGRAVSVWACDHDGDTQQDSGVLN